MAYKPNRKRNPSYGNFDQNDGKPGVVYILINEAFLKNYLKIGQTTYSGAHRASDLNKQAGTGLPKKHVCAFECHTSDCGRAEKLVHERLKNYRQGAQEFFLVDIDIAKSVIVEVCQLIDANFHKAEDAAAAQIRAERIKQQSRNAAISLAEIVEKNRVSTMEAEERRAAAARAFSAQPTVSSHRQPRQSDQSQTTSVFGQKLIAPIELFCPSCQAELNATASSEEVEKRFRCKNCQTVFTWKRFPNQANASRFVQQNQRRHSFTVDEQILSSKSKQGSSLKRSTFWIGATLVILAFVGYSNLVEHPTERLTSPKLYQSDNRLVPTVKSDMELTRVSNQVALDVAMGEVIKQYPYLATKSGDRPMGLINDERKLIESHGETPANALRRAVAAIAPGYAPFKHAQIKKIRPVKVTPVETNVFYAPTVYDPPEETSARINPPQPAKKVEPPLFDLGGHQGYPPQCRWLSQYEWSCK